MDNDALESAALGNFLQQLRKLDDLLNPPKKPPVVYQARDVAETAYLIRTLFRQGVRASLLKRGIGRPEDLESLVEAIARANADSLKPLSDLIDRVSSVLTGSTTSKSPSEPDRPAASQPGSHSRSRRTIFVVHGHRLGIVRSIASALSVFKEEIEIKVLSREVNKGRTLIEKFDETAQRAHFAIVVATGDDVGRAAKKGTRTKRRAFEKRARQNVIFEWGYFVGRITRKSVALLYEEGVRLPSDLEGTVHIALDPRQEWKAKLVDEVRASLFG